MADRARQPARALDWAAIKQKLSTSVSFEESTEDLAKLFDARATELARVTNGADTTTGTPHLSFRIGGARFSLPLSEIRTILNPRALTRIPCAPEHLAQVTYAEGRIVPLIDLAVLLQLERSALPIKTHRTSFHVIVLDTKRSPLGLLVDQVEGLGSLETSDIGAAVRTGPGAEFLRGVTSDMVLVINAEALISTMGKLARAAHA